jgi:5-methylcytosine-specific restriction enzyme A
MYLFKTSGQTYNSVINNQKHAFRGRPHDWIHGEIVLVSKNRVDCAPGERQISYTMRLDDIRRTTDAEIELYWPGNAGGRNYIVDCFGTEPVPTTFDLDEVLGAEAEEYAAVMTFKKIRYEHEALILPLLSSTSLNTPDEISISPTQQFHEGAVNSITVNAYERDQVARAACIEHFGCTCQICGFSFADTYGEFGDGYIHVHHIVPLADIRQQYRVNPVADLIPLCANCHAMIHRGKPALTIDELIDEMRKVQSHE